VDIDQAHAVAAQLPTVAEMARSAELLKALGDPTRVRMLSALALAELCVCDLAAVSGLSMSAASHQLRLLRALGLVKAHKEGRLVYYSLGDDHVAHLLGDALEHAREAR